MYRELGENVALRYFALQKVLVRVGYLRKKESKFSGNYCCLEFKDHMLPITNEKT